MVKKARKHTSVINFLFFYFRSKNVNMYVLPLLNYAGHMVPVLHLCMHILKSALRLPVNSQYRIWQGKKPAPSVFTP